MGQRGPPPLPPGERKARGTYQKCRDVAADMVPTHAASPPMPQDMPEDAAKVWRRLAPQLVKAGVLAEQDADTLEAYCKSYAAWRTMQPADTDARKLHREIIQPLALALGLHYAARSRLRKPDTGGERDAVAEELFGPLTAVQGGKGG